MTDNANLYAHFQKNFPVAPDARLLLTADGRSVTYAEAQQASARIANSLLQLGATEGDRVTVQVEKSVENFVSLFGCLARGSGIPPTKYGLHRGGAGLLSRQCGADHRNLCQ